jgi:hypothetical protein
MTVVVLPRGAGLREFRAHRYRSPGGSSWTFSHSDFCSLWWQSTTAAEYFEVRYFSAAEVA